MVDSPAISEPIASLSINEFCERYGFARSHYYVLRARGEGPAEVVVGTRKVRITLVAVDEWEKSHTRTRTSAPPAAEQPVAQQRPEPVKAAARTKKKPVK
ncbi:putative DNA-binding transcriptional regulator AlpA [Paraburkholderia sp. UCT70]|uniref:helix-turn-helix transcriptional regulator n=1 Tax=Paraburkholderia sp. UCT70 TaxID=2991068 RepID=UPI003D20AF6A